jgi:hypothetical protein
MKIKLPALKTPYWVAWNCENTGGFLVRSAYRLTLMRTTNMDEVGNSSEGWRAESVVKDLEDASISKMV